MAKYRKLPVEVEAIQFIENEFHDNPENYKGYPIVDKANYSEVWHNKKALDGRYHIKTLEGNMAVRNGEYVIKGVRGECYPCKPDIFKQTY